MAALTGMINAISEPSGLWAIIIKSFETGVGSYILAVLLLTLIIRVVWAPVDTVNRKFNKRMTRNQAKLAPQLEKLKKQYANDPQLLNRKQQELYKKANAGLGGGCLFMLVFLALNLTIFGTMFSTMNAFSRYKVYQQYEGLKYSYANVLNVADKLDSTELENFVQNYENYTIVLNGENIVLKNGEVEVYSNKYIKDFTQNKGEDTEISSSKVITNLIRKYIKDDTTDDIVFVGDETSANGNKYSVAIQKTAMKFVDEKYQVVLNENSFLWIGNIWVADSPFKESVFTYDAYKASVGKDNVSETEEVIYDSFMTEIRTQYNRTNGYFLLAIISIGITFLSVYFTNGFKKKKEKVQSPQTNKAMMFIMPLIMGFFAILYNSVFAFYLVVSQAINVLLSPFENIIVDKWENHQLKKEEQKTEVSYSRKNIK